MSEPVPIDEIQWVKDELTSSWTRESILAMDPNSTHSYIFEVDLEIPENIHDHTADYPLCPEKFEITNSMISPKSRLVCVINYYFNFIYEKI